MNLLLLIGVVVLIVLAAAITGFKPSEGRSIGKTRLMTAGKIFLFGAALLAIGVLAITNTL